MSSEARRRWFQFGLRTLILAVTVATVIFAWIAYNLHWIKQRREYWRTESPVWTFPALDDAGGPASLWLFGETAIVDGYTVVENDSEVEPMRARLSSLFPEAELKVICRKEHGKYLDSLGLTPQQDPYARPPPP